MKTLLAAVLTLTLSACGADKPYYHVSLVQDDKTLVWHTKDKQYFDTMSECLAHNSTQPKNSSCYNSDNEDVDVTTYVQALSIWSNLKNSNVGTVMYTSKEECKIKEARFNSAQDDYIGECVDAKVTVDE